MTEENAALPRCSFCGKSQDAVAVLIQARGEPREVLICEECIDLCNEILEERASADPGESGNSSIAPIARCGLCRLPIDAAECLGVPDRGVLCRACVDAITAALDR